MSADKITPSDTPRTDAAVFAFDQNYLKVNADFARQLERDLAALRAQLASVRRFNSRGEPCVCAFSGLDKIAHECDYHKGIRQRAERADDQIERMRDAANAMTRDAVLRAERAEAQLAERDAELAALKGHADLMAYGKGTAAINAMVAYRAAFPKE